MAVFIPIEEEAIPGEIPGEVEIAGVKVTIVAFGWVYTVSRGPEIIGMILRRPL